MTTKNTVPPWEEEPNPPVTQAQVSAPVPTLTPTPVSTPTSTAGAPLKRKVMDFFPLDTPRKDQELVIKGIEEAFNAGNKIVILEAPVGSGKSAIAVTLARAQGEAGAHVITPRKGLQDQYYDDFSDHLVLMKGRNAYPCTIESTPGQYKKIVKMILEGRIAQPSRGDENCAEAPCRDNAQIYKDCTEERDCPYVVAMTLAQNQPLVIHNMHSFIFQSSFGKKFEKRGLLIVDEAHEIESTIRGFITKSIYLPVVVKEEDRAGLKTWEDWQKFFLDDQFVPKETSRDAQAKAADKHYQSEKDKYLTKVASINLNDQLAKGFSVEVTYSTRPGTNLPMGTTFEFIPVNVGSAVQSMLLDYGDKVLLMSGTIYNKELYCRNLGINPENACFIRIGSSFPRDNRPIYCMPKYQVNTSHANWNENFAEMVEKIQSISKIFHDVKGLIHAPSYMAAEQLRNALNDPRYVTHMPSDFQEKLQGFYADPGNSIFISPVCQQGVDFKEDRARFQIILRVPYLNTSSQFVKDKMETDFQWYNYQSLVVFGQQIGRVNRGPGDYGATFLLDERFTRYLSKNNKMLPLWVKEAISYRG